MGVTHVTTRVSNLVQDAEPWEVEFLVTPGRSTAVLKRSAGPGGNFGPRERPSTSWLTASRSNTSTVRADYVSCAETVAQIIFGPPRRSRSSGSWRSISTGVTVDPVTKTLRRMHAKPLK